MFKRILTEHSCLFDFFSVKLRNTIDHAESKFGFWVCGSWGEAVTYHNCYHNWVFRMCFLLQKLSIGWWALHHCVMSCHLLPSKHIRAHQIKVHFISSLREEKFSVRIPRPWIIEINHLYSFPAPRYYAEMIQSFLNETS